MGLVRRLLVWLAWCAVLTASLNLLMVSRITTDSFRSQHHHSNPLPTSPVPNYNRRKEKVYLQGEVYAVREILNPEKYELNRTGLQMLSSLYKHLPAIRVQYSTISPQVMDIVQKLKRDITRRGVTDDPWDLARKWAKPRSLLPESAPGLGDVLAALSTAPITAADIGYRGTQLKVSLRLKGGQIVVFKPLRYSRDELIEGIYSGFDRHNGEIAAFHLSRLLDLRMVPLTTGRSVSLKRQILPVSTWRLSKTFIQGRAGQMCLYGVCHYCRKNESVCENFHSLEGSVIMWLPKKLRLLEEPHPWRRTYVKNKFAKWEKNESYCERVIHSNQAPRLLHLVDAAVFDFLMQNGDRHHYARVAGANDSPVVLIDNGKSFGDADVDHMDVLAPLLQCCRLHQTTYERLVLLSGGGMSQAMKELLALDPIAPVLAEAHLRAMDRRVIHILAALNACRERKGGWHNVLF
ncbi:glycosaminoglycan xylosylkinase [Penaeus vannamei]|nr:glycosaminoglycan xylosylkinase-like [Penaeus vannamei]XP_027220602.1 glycosaminoglycan xylosylkinase-like [Penaeus vannamei]